MPRPLRMRVAKEYLKLLEKFGDPKKALLEIRKMYGSPRSSVYRYVNELRAC